MLRFRVRQRPRKMSDVEGLGTGPQGRLKRLRKLVTALIRHERIESSYPQCDEARGYAEKLIQMAVRNGDRDKHTMEMADYWLLEKDLIHKLFKVLVPRYSSMPAAATSIHKISGTYPGSGIPQGVLELKGNPWPPVRPRPRDISLLLHNVLLQEARNDYHKEKLAATSLHLSTQSSSSSPFQPSSAPVGPEGSSVDGPLDSSVDRKAPPHPDKKTE